MAFTEAQKRRRSQYMKERTAWLRPHGICTSCGSNWANPGRAYCPNCLRRNRISKYKKDRDHSRERTNTQNRRAYRKANGLCYDCGEKTQNGATRCPRCAQANKERNQIFRLKKRIAAGKI